MFRSTLCMRSIPNLFSMETADTLIFQIIKFKINLKNNVNDNIEYSRGVRFYKSPDSIFLKYHFIGQLLFIE